MSDRDYYEIMGLTPGADGMMVDQSYWHLARKYQALAQSNPGAFTMLDELNEAYGVLGTSRLREQYDAFRDDVLIRKGLLKPVASKQKATRKVKARPSGHEAHAERPAPRERTAPRLLVNVPDITLPSLALDRQQWSWYAGGAAVAAVLAATIWFGLSPLLVAGVLIAVVALGATRALRHQLPAVNLTLPQITAPEIRAPHVEVPRLRLGDAGSPWSSAPADDSLTPGDLRDSTAAMISRWRNSIGLRGEAAARSAAGSETAEPSLTLLDIVATEKRIDDVSDDGEPLAAVIDILRGASNRPIELR